VFEFVEKPLNTIAFLVKFGVEGKRLHSPRHQPDVGDRPARGEAFMQGIAVLGAVGEQGLAFGQFQQDWKATASTKAWILVPSR